MRLTFLAIIVLFLIALHLVFITPSILALWFLSGPLADSPAGTLVVVNHFKPVKQVTWHTKVRTHAHQKLNHTILVSKKERPVSAFANRSLEF